MLQLPPEALLSIARSVAFLHNGRLGTFSFPGLQFAVIAVRGCWFRSGSELGRARERERYIMIYVCMFVIYIYIYICK